jgi:electron transfer flavoprotein beta subunit
MKFDTITNSIVRENIDSNMNPFDFFALEEAIRIKERSGANVTTVCMGVKSAEQTLKKTIAIGADSAVLLNDKLFAGSDTQATSYVLSKGIEKIGNYELVICGKQSTDGDTAQVGPSIAEKLNLPFVTNVVKLTIIDDALMRCTKLVERGYVTVEFSLPALITVSKGINEPRVPTIRNIIKSERTPIQYWSAVDINAAQLPLGIKGSPTKVEKTYLPKSFKTNSELICGDLDAQIRTLVDFVCIEHTTGRRYAES